MKTLHLSIHAILSEYAPLWRHSVLDGWSTMERAIPGDWLDWARSAREAEWYQLAIMAPGTAAPASLQEFVRGCRELGTSLPDSSAIRAIPAAHARGLTPKKKHEIERLTGLLAPSPPATVIDIGGGAGHLARHLTRDFGCVVHTIDRDPALQRKGLEINATSAWHGICENRVQFHKLSFAGALPDELLAVLASPGAMSIGLHTCGPLAWRHLELCAHTRARTLNLGCCYELLDFEKDINRSSFCRAHPIPHNQESLLLATRGGIHSTLAEFDYQQRVLDYRYSMDHFLRQEGHAERSRDVGTAAPAIYRCDYITYARDRLRALGLPEALHAEGPLLQSHRDAAPKIRAQRFAALLRNLLARPIEISLLTDRGLWIEEESGLPTHLIRVFDERISPRNVAIQVQ